MTMERQKRALLIGIDHYASPPPPLGGCVNDVNALIPLLARNEDDSPNFDCRVLVSSDGQVTRSDILSAVDALLAPGADMALFYFAGHGRRKQGDVVLVAQGSDPTDNGVAASDLLTRIAESQVREVTVLLDCCFSGAAGGIPQLRVEAATLPNGTSFLTATRNDQPAHESPDGRGAFSTYLCGALAGGAADVLGAVSLAGVYAYLSESFGPWEQRPMFKANVDRLTTLRVCAPSVPRHALRWLPRLFPDPDVVYDLDPSYEPTAEPRNADNEAIFAILQRCRASKLVDPVGAEHLYFAAMQNGGCRLTPLGKHYWRMAEAGRI